MTLDFRALPAYDFSIYGKSIQLERRERQLLKAR